MIPVEIVGMGQGQKDLTQNHMDLIRSCDVLIGGKRHLELFKDTTAKKIPITADIKCLIKTIKKTMKDKKVVVLASGDPLFYGIGSTLTRHFNKEQLHIHTNISSVSAAFAAIGKPWQDAKIISLHGRKKETFSFSSLRYETKIAFLTDPVMDPCFIADGMIHEGISGFRCCVLENLGNQAKEKIAWFESFEKMKTQNFSHPNVVILMGPETRIRQDASRETHFGLDDTLFKHGKGLITKSEIRAISLSKLKLIKKDHVLWDIGSGSGSVGIEASLQIPGGDVYSIEKHPDRIPDIIHNINNFNCRNIKVVNAAFPEGIKEMKSPDRVFIGGGGKNLEKIIDVACDRIETSGIIVINTVLLQNTATAMERLEKFGFTPSMVQIQVSRSKKMPYGDRLEALNPVWIISGSKP